MGIGQVRESLTTPSPFVRDALLQQATNGKVRCLTCERRCELAEGQRGWCRTRENRQGQLVTLTNGNVSSLSANPIEKKPLFHFYPGSVALTTGSWSCNFDCPWCQNWDISKPPPRPGQFLSPQQFVTQAVRRRCRGTSISFNEPTLSLEWALQVFDLARAGGLYNTFITNGYMTPEALHLLVEAGLQAMNVDLKGDAEAVRRHCQADVEAVWRNCREAKERGVWIEITTLVIPTVNDEEDTLRGVARRIREELGPDTPWHLSRYAPAYRFTAPPTPVHTLERAYEAGRGAGLEFVYLGNLPGHRAENSYCPWCGELLIGRHGLGVTARRVSHGRCPQCHHPIPGVGWEEASEHRH
jgi:pyruvate formate lyase activating enzyme